VIFRGNSTDKRRGTAAKKVKKSPNILNVGDAATTNMCGSGNPPHRLYQARAPIHPKRPYGSTRPVVPPDGSLILAEVSVEEILAHRRHASGRLDDR
jgi:hypothetical protein